mmetsp:Transcript_119469/g.338084  ORF Transcript_119469/g.338084 Transcript_119469/m.338084 type:complete len:291 (-) Transcript_119469:349-1221(-)
MTSRTRVIQSMYSVWNVNAHRERSEYVIGVYSEKSSSIGSRITICPRSCSFFSNVDFPQPGADTMEKQSKRDVNSGAVFAFSIAEPTNASQDVLCSTRWVRSTSKARYKLTADCITRHCSSGDAPSNVTEAVGRRLRLGVVGSRGLQLDASRPKTSCDVDARSWLPMSCHNPKSETSKDCAATETFASCPAGSFTWTVKLGKLNNKGADAWLGDDNGCKPAEGNMKLGRCILLGGVCQQALSSPGNFMMNKITTAPKDRPAEANQAYSGCTVYKTHATNGPIVRPSPAAA